MLKKIIELSALPILAVTVFGVSTIKGLADEQSGETKVTHTVVEPEAWALSVPSTVELEKSVGNILDEEYYEAAAKIEITKLDGTEYLDNNYNHKFSVSYTPDAFSGDSSLLYIPGTLAGTETPIDLQQSGDVFNSTAASMLTGLSSDQGEEEGNKFLLLRPKQTFTISAPKDGSLKPFQELKFVSNLNNIFNTSESLINTNLESNIVWSAVRVTPES